MNISPSFKYIQWDGDGFPYRRIATVYLDNTVEFHIPVTKIPVAILCSLIQESLI